MVVIINGAPGAGKTYLLTKLDKLKHQLFIPIRKYTTRERRSFELGDAVDLRYGCSEDQIKHLFYHYEYNGAQYGIDKVELEDALKKDMIPVIIIRSFKVIEMIKNDFDDVRVFFVIGATGKDLEERMKSQGRKDPTIINRQNGIYREYCNYITLIDHCIINSCYDEDLYLAQFSALTHKKERKNL